MKWLKELLGIKTNLFPYTFNVKGNTDLPPGYYTGRITGYYLDETVDGKLVYTILLDRMKRES